MQRPRIGLTTYGVGETGNYRIPQEYVRAVVRAGGLPTLLPPAGAEFAEQWLAGLDALVLIGGGDIDPRHYQGAEHDTLYGLDPARDSTELRLTRLILERCFPTLAVCRGMQLINTVLGGSLHVHLPAVYGEAIAHRAPPREPIPHSIEIAADSRLARQLGATRTEIVSWHHQAIDRLGAGLRAVAWADDGVIEAVELDGFERLIAVQWHPELSAERDPRQQALFDALVAMVC